MDERFKQWLNIYTEFAEGTTLRDILNDAIRCYLHDIARPALMLSYIAFLQAVRNNLLNSEKPSGFKEERWIACMQKLRNETKWDEEVLCCIKKRANGNGDPAFFELSDTLRDDVCYWKNRRNDCAHYKDSEITLSHVSAFWTFMMDNYNKFAPLGSLAQSINEYKRHYDISLTPKGADAKHLFKRLSFALKTQDDLSLFLKETYPMMELEQQYNLLHDLLVGGSHKELVISYLKCNTKRLKRYLCAKPKDVSIILGNDCALVRNIWYDDFNSCVQYLNVYAEMLRARMIPDEEVEESLKMYLKHEYSRGHLSFQDKDDFDVLMKNGLYDIFIDEYLDKGFICSSPGEKCHKTDFYIPLIYHGGITDKLILALSDAVKDTFPYTLKNRLKTEIFKEEDFKSKYLETIERLQLEDFLKINQKAK